MAVKYEKLTELLKQKNMKKIELQRKARISGNITAKISKNEYISIESIEKICKALECGVDDILEFSKE